MAAHEHLAEDTAAEPRPGGRRSRGVRLLAWAAIASAVIINVAGIAAIAMARRGAVEDENRTLRLETSGRAGNMDSILTAARADLAFLAGSPVLFGLEEALRSRDPREARWRRLEAEGGLLLLLRSHNEIAHIKAVSAEGRVLMEAGRRGGVAVLWAGPDAGAATGRRSGRAAAPAEAPSADAAEPRARPVSGVFELSTGIRRTSGAVTLDVALDPAVLLSRTRAVVATPQACVLSDATGAVLAGDARRSPSGGGIEASATVAAEGWNAPAPWTLACRRGAPEGSGLDPVATRYRAALALNLVVMSLAVVLGALVVQQARRGARAEAEARERARIQGLERQLFHAERLGTAGRLAAGMAHEINNPLEGMVNYLDLARRDLERGDVAAARLRLGQAQEGLERAVAVVRRVLTHADPATAPTAPVDAAAVAAQAVEFVRSRAEFASIRFAIEPARGDVMVRAHAALLGQVLLNLVLNACEAQPAGGEVRVTTGRIGDRVALGVADRGPGVPPGAERRIFEPFFTTKSSTGLGLSICASIVRQHGGDLAVAPRPGGGAVFTVTLPAAGPAAAASPAPASSAPAATPSPGTARA